MLFTKAVFNVFHWCFWFYELSWTCSQLCFPKHRSWVFLDLTSDSSLWNVLSPSTVLLCIDILCCSILCYANYDSIIRVSSYIFLNPSPQGIWPLWSGATEWIMHFFFFGGMKIYVFTLAKLNIPRKFRFIDVLLITQIKYLQCSK